MPKHDSIRTALTIARLAARSITERVLPQFIAFLCTIVTLYGLFTVYGSSISTGSVNDMGLAAVLWSLSMYSIYWGVGSRYIFRDISDDVKDGSIELRLVKPVHYLVWRVAHRLGRQIPMFGQQILVNSVFLMLYIGFPDIVVTPEWVMTVLGLFIVGITISLALYVAVGLCAFWIDNPLPVMWIVEKFVMIIGGAFVPIALFPSVLKSVVEWSPFGAMLAFSQAFTPNFLEHAPRLFASQLLWLLVMYGLVAIMWHMALRRVAINGG